MGKKYAGMTRSLARLLIGCALACVAPAHATEGDVVNFSVAASVTRDDNIFRLPDNFNMLAFAGSRQRGDTIRGTTFGLRVDQPWSRQRFILDARLNDYRYGHYDFLDHQARDYDLRWKWQLGNRLQGDLYRAQAQQLTSFGDFRAPNRNIRTQLTTGFSARWWIHANWYALGALSRAESENDTALRRTWDNTVDTAEAGILYRTGAGNEIQFTLREQEGEYPLSPASQFRQKAAELRGLWQITGKSVLRAQLSQVERSHPLAPQRDFSGANGKRTWDWQISGKTSLNVTARREISAYQDFYSNYVLTEGLSVAPLWRPTYKTSVQLRLERSKRDYLGDVNPLLNYHRKDTVRTAALSFGWAPLQSLNLSATLQREVRDSTDASFQYKDRLAYLSAQFTF